MTNVATEILDQHIMHTYARHPVTLVRGEGVYVWDDAGKRYLDFLGGIAVNGVGHCHPRVVQAIQEQASSLMHTSNLFNTLPQNRLADKLIATTGGQFSRVFFSNSGAEANEAALKIARKWGKKTGAAKTKVITALDSFHGRTYGSLTATGQTKYQASFAPMVPDFAYVPYNDLDALQAAMDDTVCAVLLEPILGESGIHPAEPKYLQYARSLCDHFGALLMIDEIQTGMGRTGNWWAWQGYGVTPDVFTSAKALGGGLPIGATIARGAAAEVLVPGDHGSTFAGNLVAAAAAVATLTVIESDDLRRNALEMGDRLRRKLQNDLSEHISEVRGVGLIIGAQLRQPNAKKIVAESMKNGLILNAIGDSTLRFLPPLIVTEEQVDEAVEILKTTL